jgi:hypothetical protein
MKIKRRKLILIFFYTVALQIFIFTVLHLNPTTAQSSFIAHLPTGYTAYSGKLQMGQACTCATGVLTGAPPPSLPPCGTFCYGSSSNTRYGWFSTTARGINSTFCRSSPCFQLDGDDAIVIQGSMSPIQNLTYYSFTFYQSFTTTNQPSNRYTATQGSVNLGLNNASLKIGSDGRYVVIVTANTNTLQVLENSLQRAGISRQIINNYLVPASLTNVGTSTYPDQLSLLLRLTAQTEIETQKVNAFIQQTVPATTVSFIKGPGINGNVAFEDLPKWENTLRVNQAEYTAKLDRSLAVLERSVINSYRQKGYSLKTRKTENLLHIDANLCRSLPINCQYDSPDAIYTGFPRDDYTNPVKPGFFKIQLAPNSDDVLMLLGVNHSLVGDETLATYLSEESQLYPEIQDGTFSFMGLYTKGSASQYIASSKSAYMYAVKIARTCGTNELYCVNVPDQGNASGQTGFYIIGRIYLDKVTKTGPNPANLIPGTLLWFTKN